MPLADLIAKMHRLETRRSRQSSARPARSGRHAPRRRRSRSADFRSRRRSGSSMSSRGCCRSPRGRRSISRHGCSRAERRPNSGRRSTRSRQRKRPTPTRPSIPLEIKLPEAEGVYDLVIEASERGPLRWPKSIVERRVQVIVAGRPAAGQSERLGRLDPGARNRSGQSALVRSVQIIADFGADRGSVGKGEWARLAGAVGQRPLADHRCIGWGRMVELAANGPTAPMPSWEAYPLAIAKPGTPHLLEVEYPSDMQQTLGISIIEPNAAGSVRADRARFGFYTSRSSDAAPPHWLKHRLLFWPRTTSPVVLLTNRREGATAAYGKIRLVLRPRSTCTAIFPRRINRVGCSPPISIGLCLRRIFRPANRSTPSPGGA